MAESGGIKCNTCGSRVASTECNTPNRKSGATITPKEFLNPKRAARAARLREKNASH